MRFIHIRDLYLLFTILLIKTVSWSSSPKIREFAARSMASIAYHISREKRRLSLKNISEVFGKGLSDKQKHELVRANFYEFWSEIFSLPASGKDSSEFKTSEIRGLEYLQNALKRGRGAILWESNSFGRRNLSKQILHKNGFLIYQVHAEYHMGGFAGANSTITWVTRNLVKPYFEKYQKKFVADIIYIPRSDSLVFTRQLMNLLKQNEIICITGDGILGKKLLPIKFLGHTRLFSTGMVSLARLSGASILPIFCIENGDGNVCLIIEPPIKTEGNAGREEELESSVAEYAGLLESYIRRYPEKYRSWHHLESGDKS